MAASSLQQALALLEQNEIDAAIAVLEATIEQMPAHAAAYVLLARAHEANRQWEQALKAWEQALFLVPNSPTANEGKTRALQKLDPTSRDDEPSSGSAPASPPSASESTGPHRSSLSSASEVLSELDRMQQEDASSASDPGDPSEFDRLRRMAEAEARRGGARGGMSPQTASSGDGDLSDLEQLRRQTEAEARRGGARGGLDRGSSASSESAPETSSTAASDLNDDFGDLDRLIEELESARITPTPDPTDAPDPAAPDGDEDEEDRADALVSETLARIYASQSKYREAMRVYLKLAAQKPDQTRPLLEKASAMRVEAERAEADNA